MSVPQSSLPNARDFLGFLSARISRHLDENHHGFALFRGSNHALRIRHVQLGKINSGLRLPGVVVRQLVHRKRLFVLLPLLEQPLKISVTLKKRD